MFFEQPKARTQDFVVRSLDGQVKFNNKLRLYEDRSLSTQSPYKKRISFNFFSKNKISRTQEINNRESIKPIMFEVQFNDSNVLPVRLMDKNIFIKPDHYDHHLLKQKYDPNNLIRHEQSIRL